MIQIQGVYEVAVRVRDLAKAEPFYRDVLGLEVGLRDEKRKWLFLRAGGTRGMIVLQEDGADGPLQHFAFTVSPAEIERAADDLEHLVADPEVRDPWAADIAKLSRRGNGRKPFSMSGGMVAVTEMPYAVDSRSDEPNDSITAMTPMNSRALTAGM